jgi:hypothetical protein
MSSPNASTDSAIFRAPEYSQRPAQANPPSCTGSQPYPGWYAPPPAPPKRSEHSTWLALGSVGGGLLLVCCLSSSLAYIVFSPVTGASGTLAHFCAALQDQNYSRPYATLSTKLQRELAEEEFVTNAAKVDTYP